MLSPMNYSHIFFSFFFFFNDTATTEIYTLSLHDALPILAYGRYRADRCGPPGRHIPRSEEHTSELQSRLHLVCRLLLEKKKKKTKIQWAILSKKTNRELTKQLQSR